MTDMLTILDAHCDAPSQMLRLRDFGKDNPGVQVDFPKMRRGGEAASFFAAYVPASLKGMEATRHAESLLDACARQVEANSSYVSLARTAGEVLRNSAAGRVSVMLGIENASALEGGDAFGLLEHFRERGVRYITLTHSADNLVCDSCSGEGRWGGLSPFGRELVREMNRTGMLVDLAHSSEKTMRDVLAVASAPLVYTHGCCSALSPHRRNISDDMLRGIAEGGGVACMSIYPHFLDCGFEAVVTASGLKEKLNLEDEFIKDPSDPVKRAAWEEVLRELSLLDRPGIGKVVDHIEHAVSVAGVEHVGIGTDYDGIEVTAAGLEDVSKLPLVFEEMRRRGFSEEEVEMVAGGNLLRVLAVSENVSSEAANQL